MVLQSTSTRRLKALNLNLRQTLKWSDEFAFGNSKHETTDAHIEIPQSATNIATWEMREAARYINELLLTLLR